jgi:hypothetical protein
LLAQVEHLQVRLPVQPLVLLLVQRLLLLYHLVRYLVVILVHEKQGKLAKLLLVPFINPVQMPLLAQQQYRDKAQQHQHPRCRLLLLLLHLFQQFQHAHLDPLAWFLKIFANWPAACKLELTPASSQDWQQQHHS